jgi:protein gp37
MFAWARRGGFDPTAVVRTKTWGDPPKWQREAEGASRVDRVFTCSLSDFFIEEADPWREDAWEVVRSCPNLVFQILTKRPERIGSHLPPDWGEGYRNVWLGVSVENRRHGLPRIDILRTVPAALRFLSIEPLLEWIPGPSLNLDGIGWVIVGGESGPGYRPMEPGWAITIRNRCRHLGIPFFFKLAAALRPGLGIELLGEVIQEYPPLPVPGAGRGMVPVA